MRIATSCHVGNELHGVQSSPGHAGQAVPTSPMVCHDRHEAAAEGKRSASGRARWERQGRGAYLAWRSEASCRS